jgi:hypothetical protein
MVTAAADHDAVVRAWCAGGDRDAAGFSGQSEPSIYFFINYFQSQFWRLSAKGSIERLTKQLAGTSMGSMILADGTTKKVAPGPIIAAATIFGFLFFSASIGQAVGSSWDRDLLVWLNSFAANHAYYAWELADNSLFRGFPIFFSLIACGSPTTAENDAAECWPGSLRPVWR